MAPIHRQFIPERQSVMLHNGNNYLSLPMAHSLHLKEDYTSAKMLLSALKCDDYRWEVKMVSFHMGLQSGFTKFPCFLCLHDSITKTWWGTAFGSFFQKAICSTLANLGNIIISEPVWVIIVCLCLFTMQVLFFFIRPHERQYKNFLVLSQKIRILCLLSS